MKFFKAKLKLFFHCLVKFHCDFSTSRGRKTIAIGCCDCKKLYWGKPEKILYDLGWLKK